jgi:hypothetical protein
VMTPTLNPLPAFLSEFLFLQCLFYFQFPLFHVDIIDDISCVMKYCQYPCTPPLLISFSSTMYQELFP